MRRASMDARQVLDGDFALALEDAVDVAAPRARGNVPLGDVADAFGVLQTRRGHQGDVAERGAAERRRHTVAARRRRAHGALEVVQVFLGNRRRILPGCPPGRASLRRFPAAGRWCRRKRCPSACARSAPPFHRPRDRSGCRRSAPSWSGNRRAPARPGRGNSTLSRQSTARPNFDLARKHAGDVEPHRRAQIVFHQAQHLPGLVHLYRSRGQPIVVAQAPPRN